MKHLFVPHQIALKLKEKGFDEECWAWYNLPDSDMRYCYSEGRSPFNNSREAWVAACDGRNVENICVPFYQQVIEWFYTNHLIEITCHGGLSGFSRSTVKPMGKDGTVFSTLDEALEEALKLINVKLQ